MTVTAPPAAAQADPVPGYSGRKTDYLARLAKIEGQVRGVAKMVDQDRYCTDVLTRIGAITRALQEVAVGLLQDHLAHCVTDAAQSGGAAAEAKISELAVAFRRLLRT